MTLGLVPFKTVDRARLGHAERKPVTYIVLQADVELGWPASVSRDLAVSIREAGVLLRLSLKVERDTKGQDERRDA